MVEPLKEALQYYQQLKILEDAEAEGEMTREQMTREHVTVLTLKGETQEIPSSWDQQFLQRSFQGEQFHSLGHSIISFQGMQSHSLGI